MPERHKTIKKHALNATQKYLKLDKVLLYAFIVPVVLLVLGFRLNVVFVANEWQLDALSIIDLVRTQVAYYLCLIFWVAIMLLNSAKFRRTCRVLSFLVFAYWVFVDVNSTVTIALTGAYAPVNVWYYMILGAGNMTISMAAFKFLTVFMFPVLFVSLPMLKWSFSGISPVSCKSTGNYLKLIGILILLATLPPLNDKIQRTQITPALVYQIGYELFGSDIPSKDEFELSQQADLKKLSLEQKDQHHMPINLVVIVLETTRAMSVGHLNPEANGITPFIDSLAKQSLVAERAYAVVPHTSKALTAINCGIEPFFKHPIFESHFGVPINCLPKLLTEQGYKTAFFQSPTEHFENRRGLVDHFGYEEFYSMENFSIEGYEVVNYFGYEDDVMLEPSKKWLLQQTGPFFAFYLTGATHHPYWNASRYGINNYVDGDSAWDKELNQYLNAVNHTDHFVENIINQYKELGLYENTVFLITGDHGESIYQHARYQHNFNVYQESLWVPLIVHGPKFVPHRKISAPVSHLDIVPTLVDILGFTANKTMPGKSLHKKVIAEHPAFASCWYDEWCLSRVDTRYKYIYNFDEGAEELYDLEVDFAEKNNLAKQFPDIVKKYRRQVLTRYWQNITLYDQYYTSLSEDYYAELPKTVSTKMKLLTREDFFEL